MFLESIAASINSFKVYFLGENLDSFKKAFLEPLISLLIGENYTYDLFLFWLILGICFFRMVLNIFNSFRKVRL